MGMQACEEVLILHAFSDWFLGRVVRHRTANPLTAVRFRQEPLHFGQAHCGLALFFAHFFFALPNVGIFACNGYACDCTLVGRGSDSGGGRIKRHHIYR